MSKSMTPLEVLGNIEKQVNGYSFNGTLYITPDDYGVIKSALEKETVQKHLYKFHYSSITLDYYKGGCSAIYTVKDVTVYSDNIENANQKCFDFVKYKLVEGCGYKFKVNIESICEVMK